MLIKNLLYILQQENYQLRPFFRFAYAHPKWWKLEQRGKLIWTDKTRIIFALSSFLALFLILIFLVFFKFTGFLFIIPIIIGLPIIIVLALLVLSPLDAYLKKQLIQKAKTILETKGQHLTVVGITGSYGKTSTREILATILAAKYRVLKSPDNINTDLGLAELITANQNKFDSYDVFVVEMGAYHQGEIKTICDLVNPDFSILTGINESHLERFGNIDNTISAKFELPVATKKISVLNGANQYIKDNYQKFVINQPILSNPEDASGLTFLPDFQGMIFVYQGVTFQTKLLAAHNLELILPCLIIAQELGISLKDCASVLKAFQPVAHRLEPIRNAKSNIWIIDDSYNGNINGIKSGLEVLARAIGRKIVLTPGLVELGDQAQNIHEQIGEMYALAAIDLVLLIRNKYTTFIVSGMAKHGFTNYQIYPSTQAAHADLGKILQSSDTIIFQNDWPDNYF